MNDLFIRTMMKLQESRKAERKAKKLTEAYNDNEEIKSIEDVDGYEADVVTVIDPELTTDEFIEKQDELNKLIDQTPEGEQVVSTEYVDQHIYTCPLCLTNFYSETEMAPESKCPVCYEVPTEFIYLGKVEQSVSDDDKKLLDNAEKEVTSTEPVEGEEELDTFNDIESEPEMETEPVSELVPEEEEDETLTASKKVSTEGETLKEEKVEESELNEEVEGPMADWDDSEIVDYLVDNFESTTGTGIQEVFNYNPDVEGLFNQEIVEATADKVVEFLKSNELEQSRIDELLYKLDDKLATKWGDFAPVEESKPLHENLQVGGSLYFKVKNDIVPTQIINIYVDDFNDKTYIQYADDQGRRSGTMPSEEILKGLEEGTITSENPAPAPVEQPVQEPVEASVETAEVAEKPEMAPVEESYEVAGINLIKEEFEQLEKVNLMLENKESISNMNLSENVTKVLQKFDLI